MPGMKSLWLLFSAWLAIGAFLVPFTYAETLLDTIIDPIRKDPRYQALTPDQQKHLDDMALDRIANQFTLFTNCQPLAVTVTESSKDGDTIVLTKSDIRAAAESRLRGARIYAPKFSLPFLNVSIIITKDAFSVWLRLIKQLSDGTYSQMYGPATTWDDGYIGIHGGGFAGGSFVLSSLSQLLDRFIADYLRVNEAACVKKKGGSSDEMRQRPQASPEPRDGSKVE